MERKYREDNCWTQQKPWFLLSLLYARTVFETMTYLFIVVGVIPLVYVWAAASRC